MTPQEINQTIAEACGHKMFVIRKPIHDPFSYYRENANGYTGNLSQAWKVTAEIAAKYISGRDADFDRVIMEPAPIPNYHGDLNAMNEAENTLNPKQSEIYVSIMDDVLKIPTAFYGTARRAFLVMNSTASQRAEAFLRTIGKWKE